MVCFIALVWAIYACYEKYNSGTENILALFVLFVMNLLLWWVCIPYKIITGKGLFDNVIK